MSMYNIYVEGQQRDAYVAKKAAEKALAERDEKEHVEHRDKALKSGNQFTYGSAFEKSWEHDKKIHDNYDKQEHLYDSEASDYRKAAEHSGDYKSKKKYWDLQRKAGINSLNTWGKKIDVLARDRRPAADAILKHDRRHPDRKIIECGIFAECVLI